MKYAVDGHGDVHNIAYVINGEPWWWRVLANLVKINWCSQEPSSITNQELSPL